MGGVADDGGAAFGPLLEWLAVAQHPALHVRCVRGGDELRQRCGEFRAHGGGGRVQVTSERLGSVVGAEYPPLEAIAALAADRGPAALDGATVMEDRQALSGAFDGAPVEGEAPENVQVVLAFWSVAPQGPPHERVDAVGADQDACSDDLAIGHVQPDARYVLLDALNVAVDAEHPRRQCGQHPLVQIRAEQADEVAAVLGQDVVGQVDAHPDPAGDGSELAVARCSEVFDVDSEQPERPDRRRPQVEDVARGARLRVALKQGHVRAGLVHRQGGSHASRPGADDDNASAQWRNSIHAGSSGGNSVALGAAPGKERNTSLTQSAMYALTYGRWSSPMCSAPPSAAVKIRSSRRGLAVAWS